MHYNIVYNSVCLHCIFYFNKEWVSPLVVPKINAKYQTKCYPLLYPLPHLPYYLKEIKKNTGVKKMNCILINMFIELTYWHFTQHYL